MREEKNEADRGCVKKQMGTGRGGGWQLGLSCTGGLWESVECASELYLQGERGQGAGVFVLSPLSVWLKAVPGPSDPACSCGWEAESQGFA